MRAHEFINEGRKLNLRGGGKVSLRWVNGVKKREAKRQASFDERKKFLPIIYGKFDPMEEELKQIELEKERLELARLRLEFKDLQRSLPAETKKAINKMSRREMRNRKTA